MIKPWAKILCALLASGALLALPGCDSKGDEEECSPENMCYVDTPCFNRSLCRDSKTILNCDNVHCSELCGTTCCSGGMCRNGEVETCQGKTVCYENSRGTTYAACLPPPDDASTDADDDGFSIPDGYSTSCH